MKEGKLMQSDIELLKDSLLKKFNIIKIVLFGSHAANSATDESDIDLCVIADVLDIDSLERDINLYIYDPKGLNFKRSVDIVAYNPQQWTKNVATKGSFAQLIAKKGVTLHGWYQKLFGMVWQGIWWH